MHYLSFMPFFLEFSGGTVQCWNRSPLHYGDIISEVLVQTHMIYVKQLWCKFLCKTDEKVPLSGTLSSISVWRSPISRLSELFLGVLLWFRSHSGSLFLLPFTSWTEPTSPNLTALQSIFTCLEPHFYATFPADLRHLARIYFPCCFWSGGESRASVSHHKRLCWPSGQRGKWEKM